MALRLEAQQQAAAAAPAVPGRAPAVAQSAPDRSNVVELAAFMATVPGLVERVKVEGA